MKKMFILIILIAIMLIPTVGNCWWSQPEGRACKAEDGCLEGDGTRYHFSPSHKGLTLELSKTGKIIDTQRLYTITFHNTSANDTVVYFLYHIDHKFPILRDVLPAAGELLPGRDNFSAREKGLYYVVWKRNGIIVKATDTFKITKNIDVYYP